MRPFIKKAGITFLVVAGLIGVYVYGRFDPANTFFPKCPFFWATGLKCPGCGSQRAIHQLLHFNLGAAFRYNACLVCFIPVLAYLGVASLLRSRYPKLHAIGHNSVVSWTILTIITLWWVLRNIFGW